MDKFVFRQRQRAGLDLKPADLDSDEEREAEKFQALMEEKERNALIKNRDIERL